MRRRSSSSFPRDCAAASDARASIRVLRLVQILATLQVFGSFQHGEVVADQVLVDFGEFDVNLVQAHHAYVDLRPA